MITHKVIALSFLKEAKEDLSASWLLLEGGIYSRSISNSQRAIEQTLKAALIMKEIVITTERIVSEEFYKAFRDEWKRASAIKKMAQRLEKGGTKTQYPIFRDTNPPVWIPTELYTKEDALKAYEVAKQVFEEVSTYLGEKYRVGTEDD